MIYELEGRLSLRSVVEDFENNPIVVLITVITVIMLLLLIIISTLIEQY